MLIFFVFHSSIKETKQKLTNNRTTGEGKYKFEFMKKKKRMNGIDVEWRQITTVREYDMARLAHTIEKLQMEANIKFN